MAKKETAQPKPGELPEEFALRKLVAKANLKRAKAMLSVHNAANRGRKNKDWQASSASADASIIPEAQILNARARACVRDSWIGKSAIRAFSRNVVGCGILPIPMVRDKKGNLLMEVNKALLKVFWRWANRKDWCDVERRQTFWQKQNLMVEDRATVGESLLVWSYVPNPDPCAVGLRLQSFESEQFDLRLQSFTDPATGVTNQVRGGVEVDNFGAPVAYHFYTRNPWDYLPVVWKSVRVPAARVIHYFKQDRVLQCRGVTPLAPVLQDTRDAFRYRDAMLWRAIMEACIGMVITKSPIAGGSSTSPLRVLQASDDPGATDSGARTVDFMPGMVSELMPGEDMKPLMPTAPGTGYDAFMTNTVRGIGAGIGLSLSQISRHSESNYSAARQDMLEDRKEFEPEQELMAHNVILNPIWSLFVRLAIVEGKLGNLVDANEFLADPDRFTDAEYVAPPAPWIDPEKEANAYEKLLALKVMSRSEVAALRGLRLSDIWDQLESEQEDAEERGIDLPEISADPELTPANAGEGTGATVAGGDEDDEEEPPPLMKVNGKGEGERGKGKAGLHINRIVHLIQAGKPAGRGVVAGPSLLPPSYRKGNDLRSCGTCSYVLGTLCQKYNIGVDLAMKCSAWTSNPINKYDESGHKTLAPWKPEGFPPIDSPQSDFTLNPAYQYS
jgi:lambda family phage portal protein